MRTLDCVPELQHRGADTRVEEPRGSRGAVRGAGQVAVVVSCGLATPRPPHPGGSACTAFSSWVQPISPSCSPGDIPGWHGLREKTAQREKIASKWATASGPRCALTSTRTSKPGLIRLSHSTQPICPSLPFWRPHLFPKTVPVRVTGDLP